MMGSANVVFVLLMFVVEPETVKVPEDKLVTVLEILPVVAFIKSVPVVIVTLGPSNCKVPELELFDMRKSVELLSSDPLEPTFRDVLTGTLTLLVALRLILENARDTLPEDTAESKKLPFEVVLTILLPPKVIGISVGTVTLVEAVRLILLELILTFAGETTLTLLLEEEETMLIPEVVPLIA